MSVSVIIPCYNAAKYINHCLDSLAAQDYKDFDVIIVDDCSTDNSVDVINAYRKNSRLNIQLLVNDINSGPSYSRYKAIESSNAEFVCFCDSDDRLDSDFLKLMVEEQNKENSDMVFCSLRLAFNSGKRVDLLQSYSHLDLQDVNKTLVVAPYSLCLLLSRRELFLNIPHPDTRYGEDMALIPIIIGRAKSFSAVNKCLYNYYCREDSASNKPTMKMIDSLEQSFLFVHEHLSPNFYFQKEFLGTRNYLYGALINLFKFSFDTKKANSILNKFEDMYPEWSSNIYLNTLSLPKRILLCCAKHRMWIIIKVISGIHTLLVR